MRAVSQNVNAKWARRAAAGFVVGAAVACCTKLIDYQVVNAHTLVEQSRDKRAVELTLPALRGDIVDRNGNVLASTDERYDVQMSPKNAVLQGGKMRRFNEAKNDYEVVELQQILEEIGAITGQSAQELRKIIDDALAVNPKSDFAYVKRSVDLTVLNRLKALDVPWMTFSSVYNRVYPNGAVAGNLIGFLGAEGHAQAGLELSQEQCLAGVDGTETYERSADNIRLPGSNVVTKKPVNGGTLHLTIDRDLQWYTQQTVNKVSAQTNAEWVMAVVMDAKTGELLAVAEDHSVDPNNVSASAPEHRDARAFISTYEPGSTFKALTAATLIDQGIATPLTQNLTPSTWNPEPNVTFNDWYTHAPMPWTLTGIMVKSSNVGTAMLGTKVPPQKRYEYMQNFGLGISTNVGMPVEDAGLLYTPDKWDAQSKYNITFGQGLSSTIVQTASLYQTLANGGVRKDPRLITKCVKSDGTQLLREQAPDRQVVTADTAAQVTSILENVAEDYTRIKWLKVPGYRVAGKTGTAEQSDGKGGYRRDYIYTFAGYLPAENPQYVIVKSVAFPKKNIGQSTLMPAWSDIAKYLIKDKRIPPPAVPHESLPETY